MRNVNLQFYVLCQTPEQMAENIAFGDGPKVVAIVGANSRLSQAISGAVTSQARRHHHAIALAPYDSLAHAAIGARAMHLQGLVVSPAHLMAHPEDYLAVASRFRQLQPEARPVMLYDPTPAPAFDVLNTLAQLLKPLPPPGRAWHSPLRDQALPDLPGWPQRALCLAEGSALPVEGSERLDGTGIWLGDPFADDPAFRHAWLPPGWTLTPARSGHTLWSDLRDPDGQIRFAVYFQAEPRRAFIASVEAPE
jgi:hypothetical protein